MKIVDLQITPDETSACGAFAAQITVIEEGKRLSSTCYGATPIEAITATLTNLANLRVLEMLATITITQSAVWKE